VHVETLVDGCEEDERPQNPDDRCEVAHDESFSPPFCRSVSRAYGNR
jgi:hypothetical protein